MRIKSKTNPGIVEMFIINATKRYYINIDIVFDDDEYAYNQVEIPAGNFHYNGIVDALVQYKYPIDKMQAVINNYLLDSNDEQAIEEFNNMQAWRKEAKTLAKKIIASNETD